MRSARTVVPRAASASADVPDMTKRSVMNLLLVGAIGLPATSLIGGYAYFFVPPRYVNAPRARPRSRARSLSDRDGRNVRVRDIYPN
jgi:cytochrome b6-f complex iron-sulfur subunit